MNIVELAKKQEQYITQLRREFHQHPELSEKEEWTSKRIKEELDKLQIPHEDVPGTYSVIGIINGGQAGKKIAVRADIDALPIQEESDAEYKSKIDGVMHACGHDAHAAMLIGVGMILKEIENTLNGTVYLCFQSGEEIGMGAHEVIDFLESKGGVDECIGLHIWASIKEGTIAIIDGPTMAGGAGVDICIKGQGGHGSRPDLSRDPIKPACDMALKISSIPSNFYDVLDNAVVHVGMIQAGSLPNIFPDEAKIRSGIRYFKLGGGEKIIQKINQIAKGVGEMYDVEVDVQIPASGPPVINHHEPVMRARKLVDGVEGLSLDTKQEPICASDNYAYFLVKYPGFYAFLGAMNEEKGIVWTQHNAKFDIDEKAMRKGYEFMSNYVVDFLNNPSSII